MWSPVNHIPHRNLAARAAFVVLSTGNGTALILSGTHMVYVLDAASGARLPVPARDIKVGSRQPVACGGFCVLHGVHSRSALT